MRRSILLMFMAAAFVVHGTMDACPQSPPRANEQPSENYSGGVAAARLLGTPVSTLIPGNVPVPPRMSNPAGQSAEALQRGMRYFIAFNCIGCHADNGGGGMGPALSNSNFIYGGDAANIYLSIYQGRPNGMPAWGAAIPATAIWDLVAYIGSISKEPQKEWGKTYSPEALNVEQVPSEYVQSVSPWDSTQAFSQGQKPKPRQ